MGTVTEQGQGTNRNVDSLQPLEPSDVEKQRPIVVADLPARLVSIERTEGGEVDSRRNHENPILVGAVRVDQLLRLIPGRSHEQVSLLGNLSLDPDAETRLRPGATGQAPVLDQPERVGDVSPTCRQPWPQQVGDLAGQPVVREEQVVPDPFGGCEGSDLG